MSNNPYAPPRQPDDRWDSSSRIAAKRPLTVTLLGIFYCIGGALWSFSVVYGLQLALRAETNIAPMYWSMLGTATFLAILSLVGGIGLLIGQRWGWWAAAFLSVDTIIRQFIEVGLALQVIARSSSQVPAEDLAWAIVTDFGRILFNVLLLLFLIKDSVRDYLGMIDAPWWRDIGYLLVAWACLYLATSVVPPFLGL